MPGRNLPGTRVGPQRPDAGLLHLRRRRQRKGSTGCKEARQEAQTRQEAQEGKETRKTGPNRQAQPRRCEVSPAKKPIALVGLLLALLIPASAQADFGFVPG